jgi:predicted RND superfamily exporter protein
VHRGHERDLVGKGLKHFGGVIDWILARRGLVTVFAIVATIVCAATALQLRPDARRSYVLPSGSEAAQALEHCDRAFGGIEFARVVVQWPADVPPNSPKILASILDVEKVLADEPLLRHPLSIRNIVESFPGDATSAAARMSFLDLMPPELRRFLYNPQEHRTLVTVRVQDIGLARYTPVFERVEQRLDELETKHAGFQFELTGDVVVGGRDLNQIVYDLAASLGTASVIIFVVIALVYRSARIGLITVIPNIFPLVLTAAVLVLVGSSLTVVTVCAFTICIGIAVDDTIHFLTRFQHEVSIDGNVGEAIHRTFMGVGNALVMTTIILITGFSSVLLSELPAHRTFAAMACSTIAAALIGDLIFFPALLACFAGKGNEPRQEQNTRKAEVIETK